MRAKELSMIHWTPRLLISACLIAVTVLAGLMRYHTAQAGHVTAPSGHLTVVIGNEPSSLDPAVDFEVGCNVYSSVYDGLVRATGSDKVRIVPDLATSWKATQHSSVWTFTLRRGVRFHDGSPVNAAAVKFSFQRLLSIKQGAYSLFSEIAKIDVVNPLTVRFHLKYGFAAFANSLTALCGPGIVSPKTARGHKVSSTGASYLNSHDAGSGPYMLATWQHGQRIVLRAFPGYWGGWSGRHVQTVVYTWPASSSTQRLQLEHGDLDATMNLSPRDFDAVANESGIHVVSHFAQTFRDIRINNTKPGLNNPLIRQALSYAFNYQGVVRGVYAGHAVRMLGVGARGLKNFIPAAHPYTYDLAKAQALIKQSGVSSNTLNYTIAYLPDDSQGIQIAQIYQADLAKIGIKTKLQGIPIATYGQLLNKPSTNPDIWIGSWTMDYADNEEFYYLFFYSKNTPANGGANLVYYSDPTTDRQLVAALHAPTALAAYRLYARACTRIYRAAAEVWTVQPNDRIAVRANIKGYQYNYLYGANFYPVYNMSRA
jgi:peptide/nickel transport system substrate-binding protein